MRPLMLALSLAILALGIASIHDTAAAGPGVAPDGRCPLQVPFRRVEDCRGFADSRGPDVRFFQVSRGRPDPARCRTILQGRVPQDLAGRGWRPVRRRVPCDLFGLPKGLVCLEMERRFDVRQLRVEGYDRSCSSGILLAASDASWVDACLDGRYLGPEERHRLHRHLRLAHLGDEPRAVVLDRMEWTGTSPARPVCLHVAADDLVVPTLRLDLDPGDRIEITPGRGARVRVEIRPDDGPATATD